MLLQSYFYLDILYLHHKINTEEGALCQEIYDILSQLPNSANPHNIPYIFETHNSNIRLYTYTAALLAHPVHRDHQYDILSKLEITNEKLDEIRRMDTILPPKVNSNSVSTTIGGVTTTASASIRDSLGMTEEAAKE